MSLLQLCHFPETQALAEELFWGFKLLPGASTEDGRPVSRLQFAESNRSHVRHLATSMKTDEHTETLRSEVRAEATKGRFQGSCSLQWFPILQWKKVRRGDDWRRSFHNSTVWASDSPYQGAPNILCSTCGNPGQRQANVSCTRS